MMTASTSYNRGIVLTLAIAIPVMLLLPFVLTPYYLGLVVKMMIFALFAMSLDLLIGYTGMASLGHAAYFGISAYAAGLLALKLGWSFWVAMPAALVLSGAVALVFGMLALRTRGSYFLMITLALSQLVWGIAFGWRSLTGGDDGLPNVPRPDLGTTISLADGRYFYYFVFAFVAVGALLLFRIVSSPFGYVLRGIRESETRMLALGYNVWRYKLAAFVIGALFAGLAGILYVYLNRFVSPDYIHVARSAEVLLMVILGGAGTLAGPAIGAALIVLLENVISGFTERWIMIMGVIYLCVALFAPNGMAGLVRHFRQRRVPK